MLALVAGSEEVFAGRFPQIIHREGRWLDNSGSAADDGEPRISASRWTGHTEEQPEHESEIEPDCHVIDIALQPMEDVTVFAARKLIYAGPLPAGITRVYEAGLPMRGIFRGSFDALHLHVPNTMIAEYAAEVRKRGVRSMANNPTNERTSYRRPGHRASGRCVDACRGVGWGIWP